MVFFILCILKTSSLFSAADPQQAIYVNSPWSFTARLNPFDCLTFLLLLFVPFLPAIWQTIITFLFMRYHPGARTARYYPAIHVLIIALQTADLSTGKSWNCHHACFSHPTLQSTAIILLYGVDINKKVLKRRLSFARTDNNGQEAAFQARIA
ncbi:MAG: hypothetical protein CEE38_15965 [Planctomycetes bacterium B3_Pla]|nr:MAG: hypothetical protein CEE38_15965 [Planctomycetes bacterium B3_Pla]